MEHNTMSTIKQCIARYNWIKRKLESGISLNCNEIAEELGCTAKTSQRYVNRLRADGIRLEYVPKLRGYIVAAPLPARDDRKNIISVLRTAYTWARIRHINAPWMPAAEKIIKNKKWR